jgi:hypothetical protein
MAQRRIGMHLVLERWRDAQGLFDHLLAHAIQRMDEKQKMGVVQQGVRELAVDVEQALGGGSVRGSSWARGRHDRGDG